MLDRLIGRDAQEEMLTKLDPNKLDDPVTHNFIQATLLAMGIDVEVLIETQPQTYELLRLLFCCNTQEGDTESEKEILIQKLVYEISQLQQQEEA